MGLSKYTSAVKAGETWILFNSVSGRWTQLEEMEIEMDSEGHFKDLSQFIRPISLEMLRNAGCIDVGNQEDDIVREFGRMDYSNNRLLQLTIIPTRWCNFTCRYCYQGHEKQWMTSEVRDSILRFLINALSNFDMLEVGWFGGEPLCAFDQVYSMMRKVMAICLSHKVAMYSTMSTNGYMLTPDIFTALYKVGVRNYQITIDGFSQIHDYFRPLSHEEGTFERILQNLLYIRNNSQYDKAKILLRINVSKRMLPSMNEFVCFLADNFGGDSRFLVDFQRIMDLGGEGIAEIKDEIVGEYNFESYIRLAKSLHLGMNRYEALLRMGGNVCKAARKNAYIIDYDGAIKKCSAALDDTINQIGYLDTDGIMHIDQNRENQWIQDNYHCDCDQCRIYPLCYAKACPYTMIRNGEIVCPQKNHLIQIAAICGKE